MSSTPWSYDLIADVYATDMGRSMPFDDVGWYARVAAEHAGRVLELGCGTGRITIELAARGLDVIGVDRSLPMLMRARQDAQARGIALPVAQMDLRALALRGAMRAPGVARRADAVPGVAAAHEARSSGFGPTPAPTGSFAAILLPYSLITYITEPAEAIALLRNLKSLLGADGRLVLDAFIPRPVSPYADFRLDYRREHGDGFLEREKRIAANGDGTSTIERRYRLRDAADRVTSEFVTIDRIRPYAPDALRGLADAAGLPLRAAVYDYGARPDAADAQFASLVFGA